MAIVKMIVHGDVKSFDMFHCTGQAFCFCRPDIFKILIKIACFTVVIIGACPHVNSVGKAVTADSCQGRFFSHGILPALMFSLFYFILHAVIIFACGAVIEIVAVFVFNSACLHPDAWIGRFGFFIGFDRPHLTAKNSFYSLVSVISLAVC